MKPIHGGAAALKAIERDQPFKGIAASTEVQVQEEYAHAGAIGILERDITRLQVVCDLYYQAFVGAAEAGDNEKMTSYLKVWGWLINSSIRGWAMLRELRSKQENAVDVSSLLMQYREDTNAPNS